MGDSALFHDGLLAAPIYPKKIRGHPQAPEDSSISKIRPLFHPATDDRGIRTVLMVTMLISTPSYNLYSDASQKMMKKNIKMNHQSKSLPSCCI